MGTGCRGGTEDDPILYNKSILSLTLNLSLLWVYNILNNVGKSDVGLD